MPHCIVEYSQDITLSPKQLMEVVYAGALASTLFEPADIKVRAIGYEHYIGSSDCRQFIHIELKILNGRTPQQRQHLSNLVLNQLKQLGLSSISLTVEVNDIDSGSYAKAIV